MKAKLFLKHVICKEKFKAPFNVQRKFQDVCDMCELPADYVAKKILQFIDEANNSEPALLLEENKK